MGCLFMKNFFSIMIRCKDEIYERKDRLAAEAFIKVKSFVENEKYSRCKKANEIAKFSLRGYNVKELAEKFGISVEGAKSEKRKVSEELWRIFPYDFFDKLKEYRENKDFIENFLYSLSLYNLKSDNLLLWDVVDAVRCCDSSNVNYNLSDLVDEVDFVSRYSKVFFEHDISNIDVSKLKYIVDVIDGNIQDPILKVKLLKSLKED